MNHLSSYPSDRRIDSGEFRVCYKVESKIVYIVIVGKRNDDELYKKLPRVEQF